MIGLTRNQAKEVFRIYFQEDYPVHASKVVRELQARGYDCGIPNLSYLVRKGFVSPKMGRGGNLEWTAAEVDIAAEHFERMGLFTTEASICASLNVPFLEWCSGKKRFITQMSDLPMLEADIFSLADITFHAPEPPRKTRRVEFKPSPLAEKFLDAFEQGLEQLQAAAAGTPYQVLIMRKAGDE